MAMTLDTWRAIAAPKIRHCERIAAGSAPHFAAAAARRVPATAATPRIEKRDRAPARSGTVRVSAKAALAALAGAWIGASAAAAAPVAVVTDLMGGATLAAAPAPLAILAPLAAGDRVRLAPGARIAVLYYADGAQFDARGPGTLEIAATRAQAADGAVVEPRAATGASAVRLKSGGLVQGAVVMRNRGLRVVAPDALVLSTTPDLAWTDSRSDAAYDVALFDAAGARVFETATTARTIAVPASAALRPGETYALQVSVRVPGAPVQTARAEFRVAADDLRAQALSLAPKSAAAPVADRVAYALWLEDNDLRDEARKWWAGLAQARPDDAGLRERAGLR